MLLCWRVLAAIACDSCADAVKTGFLGDSSAHHRASEQHRGALWVVSRLYRDTGHSEEPNPCSLKCSARPRA